MCEFNKIIAFALAGIMGAWSRYAIFWLLGVYVEDALWGVFIVNILGCFGFGFLWSIVHARRILLVGFMGSFTTFSSYIYDIYLFILDEKWGLLFMNSFLQVALGLLALRFGLLLNASFVKISSA